MGEDVTEKVIGDTAVPQGVITVMLPVVAPAGTVAVICEELSTTNAAFVPLKLTMVAPENPLPLITTEVPTDPDEGESETITGTGFTVTGIVAETLGQGLFKDAGKEMVQSLIVPTSTLAKS